MTATAAEVRAAALASYGEDGVAFGKGGVWIRGEGFVTLAALRRRLELAAPPRAKRLRTGPWGEWAWVAGLNGGLRRGVRGGPR